MRTHCDDFARVAHVLAERSDCLGAKVGRRSLLRKVLRLSLEVFVLFKFEREFVCAQEVDPIGRFALGRL